MIFVGTSVNNGHWQFDKQMGSKEYVGFIYLIIDNYMDKFYLGKKLYRGTGVINSGKESNWKSYISSSKYLQTHINNRPKEEFSFLCLDEYRRKGTLAYAETWTLCYVEAPTSDRWLNKRIEAISWKVSEPISQKHKDRLQAIICKS